MFALIVNRQALLSILNPEGRGQLPPCEEATVIGKLGRKDIAVVWREKPRTSDTAPNAIVLNFDQIADTLAWAATYLPQYRPITSIVRLIDTETFDDLIQTDRSPELGGLAGACVGLIAAETVAYSSGRAIAAPSFSTNAFASTLSYILSRALATGYPGAEATELRMRWLACRELTNQKQLSIRSDSLDAPWLAMFALNAEDFAVPDVQDERLPKDVLTACFQSFETGRVSEDTWRSLAGNRKYLTDAMAAMEMQREERVRAFQRAAEATMRRKARPSAAESFVFGYLASRISPGSLDHFELLDMVSQRLPEARLWYGLLAGLQDSVAMQNFSNGLGRRILREILRPESILDQPTCDVSINELEVLSESSREDVGVRSTYPGYLEIELAPRITTLVMTKNGRQASTNKPAELLAEELYASVDVLSRKLSDLNHAVNRIARIVGLGRK